MLRDSQVPNRIGVLETQQADGQLRRFVMVYQFTVADENWYHPTYPGEPNSKWDQGSTTHWMWCDRCQTRFIPEEGLPGPQAAVACWCCGKEDDVRRV